MTSKPPKRSIYRKDRWKYAVCGFILLGSIASQREAAADDTVMPPCAAPPASALADRPGTGRATSSGGSPCVALPGQAVFEFGVRDQNTQGATGSSVLTSVPLTFIHFGIADRLEFGIAPPVYQHRSDSGLATVDAAHGQSDVGLALKYLLLDGPSIQSSVGASYGVPSGTGEFTAGAPTFSLSVNLAVALTSKLSFATSQIVGTAIGPGTRGLNQTFFVYTPSFTLGYVLDSFDTLLIQDALASRQGPIISSGSRGFVAITRSLGSRLAIDVEYEKNFAPTLGNRASAFGGGFVWTATPPASL